MGKNLQHFVPNRFREVPGVRGVNLEKNTCGRLINQVEVLCHEQLNDEDVSLHVTTLATSLQVRLGSLNQPI